MGGWDPAQVLTQAGPEGCSALSTLLPCSTVPTLNCLSEKDPHSLVDPGTVLAAGESAGTQVLPCGGQTPNKRTDKRVHALGTEVGAARSRARGDT